VDIGKKITALKKQKGLTTNKLAGMARIAQSALRSIELGEKSPTIDTLSRILNALGITMAEFFDEPNQQSTLINPPKEELKIAHQLKELPPEKQREVEMFIRWQKYLMSENELAAVKMGN